MREAANARSRHLSWAELHDDACALAHQLRQIKPWEVIVAITRGGLIPAAIIARELDIRLVETLGIASYDGRRQSDVQLLKPLGVDVAICGDKAFDVLVIDDLADTGKTAHVVREMLPNAHFATLYVKPMGRPLVDTFVSEIEQDIWIYFPWDRDGP